MNRQRRQTRTWIALGLLAIALFAALNSWLAAPTAGEPLDPEATSTRGSRALVSLIRARGVEVVVARSIEDVEREARSDTLLVLTRTDKIHSDTDLGRLSAVPGDRLIVAPSNQALMTLAPELSKLLSRKVSDGPTNPDCSLREANQAGSAEIGNVARYFEERKNAGATLCYDAGLARYGDHDRQITVVDDGHFMTNDGLLADGNAALAMNLTGTRARVVWFSPRPHTVTSPDDRTLSDLAPVGFYWLLAQLGVVVVLLALYQGRRLGPLVAERIPVVVRSSEAVEGRAQLYRATRAREQAAAALRTATLKRIIPRLGIGAGASPTAVADAVAQYCPSDAGQIHQILFGPSPSTDSDLLRLGQALADIERQIRQP